MHTESWALVLTAETSSDRFLLWFLSNLCTTLCEFDGVKKLFLFHSRVPNRDGLNEAVFIGSLASGSLKFSSSRRGQGSCKQHLRSLLCYQLHCWRYDKGFSPTCGGSVLKCSTQPTRSQSKHSSVRLWQMWCYFNLDQKSPLRHYVVLCYLKKK